MIDYMWRIVLTDSSNEVTTVALFLLESDARKWAAEENKEEDGGNYSVVTPKRLLTN